MFGEPLYAYFGCGARLIYLRHARQRLPIHGQGYIINVITLFLEDLDRFPFVTTRVAADKLRAFYKTLEEKPENYCLTDDEANELARLADELTPTFEAESRHIQTVVLTEKRFETGKLMGRVSALFPPGIYDRLPDLAKHDMDEAGKCIALARATASAFHCLRATEAVLRHFYFYHVKRKRLRNPMWHGMLEALRNKQTNRPPREVIDHLDMIRNNYRNPTQHPEKLFDIEEAQDLFSNCIGAIHMMLKAMK